MRVSTSRSSPRTAVTAEDCAWFAICWAVAAHAFDALGQQPFGALDAVDHVGQPTLEAGEHGGGAQNILAIGRRAAALGDLGQPVLHGLQRVAGALLAHLDVLDHVADRGFERRIARHVLRPCEAGWRPSWEICCPSMDRRSLTAVSASTVWRSFVVDALDDALEFLAIGGTAALGAAGGGDDWRSRWARSASCWAMSCRRSALSSWRSAARCLAGGGRGLMSCRGDSAGGGAEDTRSFPCSENQPAAATICSLWSKITLFSHSPSVKPARRAASFAASRASGSMPLTLQGMPGFIVLRLSNVRAARPSNHEMVTKTAREYPHQRLTSWVNIRLSG